MVVSRGGSKWVLWVMVHAGFKHRIMLSLSKVHICFQEGTQHKRYARYCLVADNGKHFGAQHALHSIFNSNNL